MAQKIKYLKKKNWEKKNEKKNVNIEEKIKWK